VRVEKACCLGGDEEDEGNSDGQSKLYEMVRITGQISSYSANKSLILTLEIINDFEGHAALIV